MGMFDWNDNGEFDLFDAMVTRSFFRSVEKAERKAQRKAEFWENFWDAVFNTNGYNGAQSKWKPSNGFKKLVTVLLVMLGIVIIYAKISNM